MKVSYNHYISLAVRKTIQLMNGIPYQQRIYSLDHASAQ